jgi:hypothetical protein
MYFPTRSASGFVLVRTRLSELFSILCKAKLYHILKVEGRKKETQPLDQVRSQIETQIKERKQASAFEAHMTKLKESTKFQAVAI